MNWFRCQKADNLKGAIVQISVHDLKARLDNDNTLPIIDVRTQDEYEAAHVPHIKARIEYHEIAQLIDPEKFPKDQPIYLICRAGRRSMVAARELKDIGYQKLINVAGGTAAWLKEDFPVIKR
ncbi:MAG: rhodanese-like domain-containing protein [Candidatus Zixiibacteriota bacterium]